MLQITLDTQYLMQIMKYLNFIKKTEEGEIVIKGGSVLKKYLANDKANSSSFIDGWFRTGDLGYFDKDGHLFISGRIKEIINRGGEKVSPKEIDDVFSKHPKISKVVAFAVKHDKLDLKDKFIVTLCIIWIFWPIASTGSYFNNYNSSIIWYLIGFVLYSREINE